MKLKPRLDTLWITAGIVLIATLVAAPYVATIEYDTDRFYHLALSRIYAAGGFPATLPQVEDIGWGQAFAEKEFLFHALTGFAWKIAGENGVIHLYRLLFALLMTSLGFALARASRRPWIMPLATFAFIVCCSQFSARMNMLRPHVLAVLLMTWQVMALTSSNWRLAAILSGIYVLSYHAFYIPMAVTGIFLVFWWLSGREVSRPLGWTLLAMAAGIVMNPAFPLNFVTGIQVFEIATQRTEAIPEYFFGEELHLLNSAQLLTYHGYVLLLPVLLLFFFARTRGNQLPSLIRARQLRDPEILATLVVAILFSGLLFLTPRAFEIAVPAGILAVATMAGHAGPNRVRAVIFFLATFTLFHVKLSLTRSAAVTELSRRFPPISESIRSTLSVIPANQSLKVFNWAWWLSPLILYHRPDLKFIDILDPTFLQRKSPEMSRLRIAVFEDRESDPWYVVRNVFHADYVMVPPSMAGRWAADPHFNLTRTPNPPDAPVKFTVLEVAKQRVTQFVKAGRNGTSLVDTPFTEILSGKVPKDNIPLDSDFPRLETVDVPDAPPLVFIETLKSLKSPSKPGNSATDTTDQSLCTRLQVDPAEIGRITAGTGNADYIGVGGGTWIGVWINGRGVYQGENPYAPRLVDRLIDLGSLNIKYIQSIEAVACTKLTANRAGLAVSLWTRADVEARCGQSSESNLDPNWLGAARDRRECLGAIVLE